MFGARNAIEVAETSLTELIGSSTLSVWHQGMSCANVKSLNTKWKEVQEELKMLMGPTSEPTFLNGTDHLEDEDKEK